MNIMTTVLHVGYNYVINFTAPGEHVLHEN